MTAAFLSNHVEGIVWMMQQPSTCSNSITETVDLSKYSEQVCQWLSSDSDALAGTLLIVNSQAGIFKDFAGIVSYLFFYI